jgi:hypothetical protein
MCGDVWSIKEDRCDLILRYMLAYTGGVLQPIDEGVNMPYTLPLECIGTPSSSQQEMPIGHWPLMDSRFSVNSQGGVPHASR